VKWKGLGMKKLWPSGGVSHNFHVLTAESSGSMQSGEPFL